MIPGKKYRPEDLVEIAWRRRWLILLPFVVLAVATAAVSYRLPNRYRSDTLILVVPQRVPEQYVHSTVSTRIEDRLQSISQQILSRTKLERIIQDFNLYPEERRTGIMEDVVDHMRTRDIEIQIVKGDAFRVAYTGFDPRTVMKVTERLASFFIDESLRDREVMAEGTNQFLEAQLEDARRQLVDHEKKLEAYKRKYDGQLPTQVESNLQAIRSTELQLQALTESLNRDRDQEVMLQRQIADLSIPEVDAAAASLGLRLAQPGPVGPSTAEQLEAARANLAALETRLKPEHPDVVRMKKVVSDLEAKVDAEALQKPVSPGGEAAPSPRERARQNRLHELQAAHDIVVREIAQKQEEQKRLQASIGQIQQRVAASPTRESELVELTRDYDTLQKGYASLLAKKEDSKIAANLERRQIGEQFKVLDPARLPERPSSPNRLLINATGAGAGLLLGVALIALLEYRDTTLKTDGDVIFALSLPVLGCIPVILSHAEHRAVRRRRWYAGVLIGAIFALTVALVVWKVRT